MRRGTRAIVAVSPGGADFAYGRGMEGRRTREQGKRTEWDEREIWEGEREGRKEEKKEGCERDGAGRTASPTPTISSYAYRAKSLIVVTCIPPRKTLSQRKGER